MNLDDYGWDDGWAEALPSDSVAARIVAVHQRYSDVVTAAGPEVVWNTIPPRRLRPATGDWVALTTRRRDDRMSIAAILPRRSRLLRRVRGEAAASSGQPDVAVANIDLVFVVAPLAAEIGDGALARYVGLALESGAAVQVVMPKRDLRDDALAEAARVQRVIAMGLAVHPVSATTGEGLDAIVVPAGHTVALLGPSGAGKSTLLNWLLGAEVQRTGDLSAGGTGKHTTSTRQLRALPGGGMVIDTPGIGNVRGAVDWSVIAHAFPDVAEAADQCRFTNCGHGGDDGCAISAAVAAGEIDSERWDLYCTLQREA